MRGRVWAVATILGLGAIGTAWANDDWVAAEIGAKPNRELVVVDAASIRDRVDVAGFMASAPPDRRDAFVQWIEQKKKSRKGVKVAWPAFGPDLVFQGSAEHVYEAAKQPSIKAVTYRVNCTRQTLTALDSLVLWRDKPIEKGGATAERPVSTEADRRLMAFLCSWGSGAWGDKVPEELGLKHLGNVTEHLPDYVWANLWRDGKQPERTYRASQKEIDDTIASAEKTMAEVAATQRAAMEGIQRFHQDAARVNSPASSGSDSRGSQYPCPNGPGAGERQIGATQGGNGLASVPLCSPVR